MYMKKNLSFAGLSLAAIGLFMGSCVSKRKYMEAQTSATERYRTDSTQWADRSNTMQQNVTSLEQKSTTYQKQMDSFKTSSMNYQKRWDNFQSAYTQQNSSTEQLHQQIHTAIDQYVEASNVESRNGKVYVNLPEKMLFTGSSSTISAKGKQALDKLAEVIAANDNIEVDIISTAAYYNGSTGMATVTESSDNMNKNSTKNNNVADNSAVITNDNITANNNVTGDKSKEAKDKDIQAKDKDIQAKDKDIQAKDKDTEVKDKDIDQTANANIGDSSFAGSGSVTSSKNKQDPNKKQATAKKTTTQKPATASTTKKINQGDRSVTFKSTPKSTKVKATPAPSWNLNVARSTAIVRELTQNGLPHARIVLTGQNGKGITTNEWASTNRGYQIVLSPKMDSYYQMMQEGQGSTSMK